MIVYNRSNDIIWGAYGANAVHFSYLLEYMAARLEVPVGKYYQVSNNFHAYKATLDKGEMEVGTNPYSETGLFHHPLMNVPVKEWEMDLKLFFGHGPITGFSDPFFRNVATPIYYSYRAFQEKGDAQRFMKAKEIIEQCQDPAWKKACWEWLDRREVAAASKNKAQDDGVNYDAATV